MSPKHEGTVLKHFRVMKVENHCLRIFVIVQLSSHSLIFIVFFSSWENNAFKEYLYASKFFLHLQQDCLKNTHYSLEGTSNDFCQGASLRHNYVTVFNCDTPRFLDTIFNKKDIQSHTSVTA